MSITPIPMPSPTNPLLPLTSYTLLSFDIYGTIIQYKSAILQSFKPLINKLPPDSPYRNTTPLSTEIPDSATIGDIEFLKLFQKEEDSIKLELAEKPLRFDAILKEIYQRIARRLDLDGDDVNRQAEDFGSPKTIESWPPFPGTIDALKILAEKSYQLVALSNIDRYATDLTFSASTLSTIPWTHVFTAEDFGTTAEDLKHADERKLESLLAFARERGVRREEVLHVAQSLGHDHAPCKRLGISSVFLVGDGPVWGKSGESQMAVEKELVGYGWRCEDLKAFARVVLKEGFDASAAVPSA